MFNNPCTFLLTDMNWKDAISSMSYNNTISQGANTRNSKFIKPPPEVVYRAFIDPDALAAWQAPGDITAKPHNFDGRVGGGYEMSLFYPSSEKESRGKTTEKEDRYVARFVELEPSRKIVEAVKFDSRN